MPSSDPNFASVVLLLHCDGANASTTLADSSSSHKSVTSNGQHKLTTAQAKFGSASFDCTTSGGGTGQTPDSADWLFGAGQFTVEAWVRTTLAISGQRVIVGQWAATAGGQLSWVLRFNTGVLDFGYSTTGADSFFVTATYSPTLNQWTHFAADRDASNVLRLYVDGVVVASGTAAATFFNSTQPLYIGNDGAATRAFTGQIDEVRVTNGVARYAGAFTPPTASFPDATDARIGGVAREGLISSDGIVNLGGVVRETLMSGLGVDGWVAAKSSARAYLDITQNLTARAKAKSSIDALLTITGGVTGVAAGAGGGGAAGLYGVGEYGQGGQYDGIGGYGGSGDLFHTPRQTTPGTTGFLGTEWDGTYGSGSGGSGGNWGDSGHGGNGGVGGLYGGGGGGGGGGHAGGGLGALGGEGVIYLEYDPGTGPIVIVLTKDSPSPFTFPLDWSTTNNTVLIVGAGGCGKNGGLTTGGGGGGGGSVVGAVNTGLFTPGQVLAIDIPSAAEVCAGIGGNTFLGIYSAPPGVNGDGSTGGTPIVPIDPGDGGIGSGGGTGGGGGGGPSTGGPGGGVATLVAGRITAHSFVEGVIQVQALPPRQYAVSVQTWHW